MANLGTINCTVVDLVLKIKLQDPPPFSITITTNPVTAIRQGNALTMTSKYNNLWEIKTNGIRQGVVSVNGLAVQYAIVRLYWRENGLLLDQVITNANGEYKFIGLDPTRSSAYYITAMDPATDTPFNYTLTHDHLTATPE